MIPGRSEMKKTVEKIFILSLIFTLLAAFCVSAAPSDNTQDVITSDGPSLTIVKDGFWHITYDKDNVASCRFYMMPIRSERGETFSYARNRWVCEPYETRTLWYFVGEDEYLVKGWQNIDGLWYYFQDDTGRMYADEMTPDGYYVGPDGSWTGN